MVHWSGHRWFGTLENDVWHSQDEVGCSPPKLIVSEMDQERFNCRLAMAPYIQAEEDIQ